MAPHLDTCCNARILKSTFIGIAVKILKFFMLTVGVPAAIVGLSVGMIALSRVPFERVFAPKPQESPEVKLQKQLALSMNFTPGLTSQSSSPAPEGTLRIRGSGRVGCSSERRYEKLMKFAVQNDDEAFRRELTIGVSEGDCTVFEDNQPVYMSSGNALSGRAKLRRPGETIEYWAPFEAAR